MRATIQQSHILVTLLAPAPIEEELQKQAQEIAVKCVEEIDGIGSLGWRCSLRRKMRIPFFIDGNMQLGSNRFAGITSFIPEVTVNFSQMQFSPTPNEMRVWLEGESAPATWVPYQANRNYL